MMSWIGWVATACFGLFVLFQEAGNAAFDSGRRCDAVDQLRIADPRHAGSCGERNCGAGGLYSTFAARRKAKARRNKSRDLN